MALQKKDFLEAVQKARDASKKRNFTQSFELAVNFKNIDFKKPENRIDVTVKMPFATGKESSNIAVFVRDKNFAADLKGKAARVIMESEIEKIGKKEAGKLAEEFDAFLAEGQVMLTVGKHLGQVLAPKGKMPRPIQPSLESVESVLKSLKSGIRISNKKGKFMPVVHIMVGKELMQDEQIAENCLAVYNAILPSLSNEDYNIKSVFLKLSMGPAVKVGEKETKQRVPVKKEKQVQEKNIAKEIENKRTAGVGDSE